MTFARDLAWQNLELAYRSSIAHQFARYALTLNSMTSEFQRDYQGTSEITTKDGRWFQKRVDTPPGFGDDPLTDGDLEDKFREMATKYMSREQIQKIFDTVWNAESLDDMSNLTRLMVFSGRQTCLTSN